MTEQVIAGFAGRDIRAVSVMRAFGNDDKALGCRFDAFPDPVKDLVFIKGYFRQDQHVDDSGKTSRSSQPAGITSHRLKNKHFLAGRRIDIEILPALQSCGGDKLRG